DESISSKIKLSVYYSATHTLSPQTNGFSDALTIRMPQDTLAQTSRVNLDDSVPPTLLLHFGAGFLHTSNPSTNPTYDQAANNLFPAGVPFPGKNFPYISGLTASSFLPAGFAGGGPFPT